MLLNAAAAAEIRFDGLEMIDPERDVDIRVRTGMTAPLVDARIIGQDMKDLPHDGESASELVLRSPWLTQGYVGNPDASEALWAGGYLRYLHTGDIAVVTPYGSIVDRIKDVIKSGGEWVVAADRGADRAVSGCEGSRDRDS
jgi:fatty-acyl-CoA synthase